MTERGVHGKYMTREAVYARSRASFEQKLLEEERLIREGQMDPAKRTKADHWNSPVLRRHLEMICEDLRSQGRLVTERQLEDIRTGRRWQQGDRARYVGQTRLEPIHEGGNALRNTGQVGRIVEIMDQTSGERLMRFRPDAPRGATDEHGPEVMIVDLLIGENSAGILSLERLSDDE